MTDKTKTERQAFDDLVDHVLAVPHSEIVRREKEYQGQQALKPKRGPKRKIKSPAVARESSDGA